MSLIMIEVSEKSSTLPQKIDFYWKKPQPTEVKAF